MLGMVHISSSRKKSVAVFLVDKNPCHTYGTYLAPYIPMGLDGITGTGMRSSTFIVYEIGKKM